MHDDRLTLSYRDRTVLVDVTEVPWKITETGDLGHQAIDWQVLVVAPCLNPWAPMILVDVEDVDYLVENAGLSGSLEGVLRAGFDPTTEESVARRTHTPQEHRGLLQEYTKLAKKEELSLDSPRLFQCAHDAGLFDSLTLFDDKRTKGPGEPVLVPSGALNEHLQLSRDDRWVPRSCLNYGTSTLYEKEYPLRAGTAPGRRCTIETQGTITYVKFAKLIREKVTGPAPPDNPPFVAHAAENHA